MNFFLNKQIFFPFQYNEDIHARVFQVCLTRKCVGPRHVGGFEVSELLRIPQVYDIVWITV